MESLPSSSDLLSLGAGLALLFFGRRLFWLLLGVLGFVIGLHLGRTYLDLEPTGGGLLLALLVGLAAALLAIFFQRLALAVAGFLVAGYCAWWFAAPRLEEPVLWIVVLVAAFLGTLVARVVFELALVIVSSAVGATMVAEVVMWEGAPEGGLWLALFAIGAIVQLMGWSRHGKRS